MVYADGSYHSLTVNLRRLQFLWFFNFVFNLTRKLPHYTYSCWGILSRHNALVNVKRSAYDLKWQLYPPYHIKPCQIKNFDLFLRLSCLLSRPRPFCLRSAHANSQCYGTLHFVSMEEVKLVRVKWRLKEAFNSTLWD